MCIGRNINLKITNIFKEMNKVKKMPKPIYVEVPQDVINKIDKLIELKYYTSRADFARRAIIEHLKKEEKYIEKTE